MNKTKPIKPAMMQPKPLTKEEQAQRFAQFLAQKKEQLFQGCLFSLLSNPGIFTNDDETVNVFFSIPSVVEESGYTRAIVDVASNLADLALKKMYNLDGKEGE